MQSESLPSPGDGVEQLMARQEAFVRLFAANEPIVMAFVMTLVPTWDDASEILQETSSVAWRKFDEFEPGSSFLNWMYRIAELEVRNFWSRRKRQRVEFSDQLIRKVADTHLVESEYLAERRRALEDCIAKLRESDRMLLRERYVAEQQGKKIAAALGQPADSIYKALKRIRLALYECVNRTLSRASH
jgi:RNA polymerase sigma-70 factor, ECF subfamily